MTKRQSTGLLLALFLAIVALALAVSALLSWPPIGPVGGTEAIGDTNFTNLVASGDLTVGDDATIADALSAADLAASDDLTVGDDLTVAGDAVANTATITGALSADSAAITAAVVAADLTASDDLVVGDDADITGTLTAADLYSNNRLTVDGETALNDAVTIAANLSVTGTVDFSGAGGLTFGDSVENLNMPTVDSASVVYTSTGALWTCPESEVWFVHALYCHVTTNFDCTGSDCTMTIGDGNDTDGFLVFVDAELQTTDTEGTGAPAGWQGFMSTDVIGAYLAEGLGFVYTNDTIDVAIGGTDPAAGAATCYLVYTRIQ